ncbi:ABC transporter ATP-binding protein [Dyella subtropica]|uniref:ABC transporter ATP-binding protein n=1 Tax=Dyella subtropica TaxID=2992127 RepID=UPI0022580118|nr:ABC transporter ATP-binding protein [Dyella subtropica]
MCSDITATDGIGAVPQAEVAIRIRGLSKCYHIYATPRDRLKQFVLPRLRRLLRMPSARYYEEFWATRDVTFEVGRGETVGIIGRNGSGKSTLLQIICGTLTPTQGDVETHGRVAALLELGSGFNPEFTGRENVYLNGAVLGLTREEIDARLSDILAFADIGAFIEQPVKTYSSGMYVRLAFAVVAHVDPEILIVDEALSVGDAFFQSKCAALMRSLIKKGTTILFVSHDTHSVKSLCDKAILLESGSIVAMGDTNEVVEQYYAKLVNASPGQSSPSSSLAINHAVSPDKDVIGDVTTFNARADYQRIYNQRIRFLNVRLVDEWGRDIQSIEFKQRVTLRMILEVQQDLPEIGVAYHIRDMKGVELVYSDTGQENNNQLRDLRAGQRYVINWTFEASLREGQYNFACMASIPKDLAVGAVDVCDFVPYALQFQVGRGRSLPIYAAVHWRNELTVEQLGVA